MHLTIEELNRLRAGAVGLAEAIDIAKHTASCEECRAALRDCACVQRSVRDLRLDMEAECIAERLPEEVLMAHADGLLDAEQRELANMHLEACLACREELDELRDLKKTLATGR